MTEATRPRTEAAERKRVERITRKVSATVGNDYLQSLVKHMADALSADCVYAAELIHGAIDRITALAVRLKGEWSANFEQDLQGTATAHVVAEGSLVCSANVTQLFPMDQVLEDLGAQAYVGYRLSDSAGQVLGVLAAVYRERRTDWELPKSVLEVFVPRAAAELERKRDLEVFRRADERHRAFIASSMDALWRIELEKPVSLHLDEEEQIERIYQFGYLAECNGALARLIGAPSSEELLGARFETLVPRSNPELAAELRSMVRTGYRAATVEATPVDSQGRRMYRLRSQFGIVENDELQRLWGATRDITELRRTELALRASERRSREMLERLQLPAVVVDPRGAVLFANDALLRLGRWTKQELAAKSWFDVLADQESRDRWMALYSGAGPDFAHLESSILCSEGIPRSVSWDTARLLDTDGEAEGIAAIGTDITGQKAVEAQVRQAQKLEGIGRLAAGVAHDFNNLFTVILGHASGLLDTIDELNPIYYRLAAIRDATIQCAALTEQLLAVGGKQRLQLAIFDLNSVIARAEAVIHSLLGEKVELDLQLDRSLWPVHADPGQIERVLTNLAANARDAMPEGGKLVIATANANLDETSASAAAAVRPGAYVRLTLTDTGIGMTEEVQARIFDPFFTTKEPGHGTGLGLSTVYGIVGQSGGFISVQSQPGEGAVFTILLPAAHTR